MGSAASLIVPLEHASAAGERQVGGKAAKLSKLIAAGYRVPNGFVVTAAAYRQFVEHGNLERRIDMETARKPMESMRWEEIWDAALRLRTAFLNTPVPADVSKSILAGYRGVAGKALAVRSSAVGEDSAERSYAGLHESVVDVMGEEALLDAVRMVWASLWSDAALLYRSELKLESRASVMAVVVQELVMQDVSGVSFGRDPRDSSAEHQIIEAVPGLCRDLVDGVVDPDRWLVRRSNGEIIEWYPGRRSGGEQSPLLEARDIGQIHGTLNTIERTFGWPPDIEWTGRGTDFTVLQARPVTTSLPGDEADEREWYLSLRPGKSKLEVLCKRVSEELIPALEAEGYRLAEQQIEGLSDERLAAEIDERSEIHTRWKKIYWDEFIPFAHGVRQLGTFYNDAVKPEDPYEFIGILRHQPMIASERNDALRELAAYLKDHTELFDLLIDIEAASQEHKKAAWSAIEHELRNLDVGREFLDRLNQLSERYMAVVYQGEQLDARPDLVLHAVIEMARLDASQAIDVPAAGQPLAEYESRLFAAVGPERHAEAKSVIEIGRLSWRLRDDDNVLLGRVEKQLLRAASIAAERLVRAGRLDPGSRVSVESATILSAALRDEDGSSVVLGESKQHELPGPKPFEGETPRQIVGQPAAPGLATAKARVVRSTDDLSRFRAGEVLVCDAIQPTMSHIVPLAAAIVERRGGMLIHGAIIARELGVPCVNGVSDAILSIADGEIVTVDGHLGIVTIGPPEFDLEVPN